MPSDASIYSLIQQPKPLAGPLEQYAQIMQVKHLMGQNELADLQRGELQRGIDEGQKIRALFQRGNVKPEEVYALNPTQGAAYQKNLLESQKNEAELAKTRAETLLKNASYLRDELAGVNDQAGYNAWLEKAIQLVGPDAARKNPPQFTPEVKKALLMKADDVIVPLAKQMEMDLTRRGQDITIRGQDQANERGWAGINKPVFSEDRGVFISPPRVGPATPPFAGAPSASGAIPAGAPAPAVPPAPRGAPVVTEVPGITPKPKLTPGQEALDREFAKELAAFKTGGGADQMKQLAQLNEVRDALQNENVTGTVQGVANTLGMGFLTPRSTAIRERVEEVVQRSLRAILGAQFTEREGERLIARAYNPYLGEPENLARVNKLITQLESAFKSKSDAAAYFEKNGTLAGWQGKMPTLADFDPGPVPPKGATKGGPSKAGGIKFLGFE